MGQFSWIYSDTGKQMVDNKKKDSFLLVPPKFYSVYGDCIVERQYDGYGHFKGHDIFELVAEWNRDMIPEIIRRMNNGTWGSWTREYDYDVFQRYYNEGPQSLPKDDRRWVGILMTQDDGFNRSLEFPIKITEKPMSYDMADPSNSDPNQGWEE